MYAIRSYYVHQTVIEPGNFAWNWERLLPTNSTLKVFALAPRSVSHTSAGVLPSGKLFAGGMEGNPDFSWNVSLTVTARLDPAKLPALLKDSGIRITSYNVCYTKLLPY